LPIQPIYKHKWTELLVVAVIVSVISLVIDTSDHGGIIIISSFASTSLALMVAPEAVTNSIRSVFLSYMIALFVSVAVGLFFSAYIEQYIENGKLIFFLKFLILLLCTLFLFGYFNSYHPPSIGAMLAYTINTGFEDVGLLIYVPLSVIFLLVTIKSYIYIRHPDEHPWKDFPKEFSKFYKDEPKEP